MATDENKPDQFNNGQPPGELPRDAAPVGTVDYELTAKDAGWRSPTLFVSRAKVTVFDPPRPMKQADNGEE